MGFEIKNSEKDGRFMRLNWSKPSKRAYEECGRIAIFRDRESRGFVDDEQAKEDSAMESYKLAPSLGLRSPLKASLSAKHGKQHCLLLQEIFQCYHDRA
ncbi:hypothetical protein TorRG33x02_328470 [Trema orientale]|uniref:Uncharacterized protein n=1 Tax=Trema orientale TaxID=63057 RepID=A0A2P5B9Q9_TREOI|nr:hypothetical protein TorRG33x02_328470 [Trema orientale]